MSTRKGEETLEAFATSLASEQIPDGLLRDFSLILFREATIAYDAGSYLATAILCRSTLETAFFIFLTGRAEAGQIRIEIPRYLNDNIRNVSFQELKTAIVKKVIFEPSQLKAIKRIQDDGNLIAHFASKRMSEVQRFDELIMKSGLEKARTAKDWRRIAEQVESRLKIWITKDQALDDLKDASSIILTVFRHQKFFGMIP